MSASRPPSTMLRAATATSGGTDAPLLTYCSIWPWIEAISASISRVFSSCVVDDLDPRLEVRIGLDEVEQADPALSLDDRADRAVLEADHLGDLRQRPDRVELLDAADLVLLARALGDESHRLRGAHGTVERLDAPIASDLEGDDHLGEDHRVAQRDERQHLHAVERRAVLLLVGRVDLGNVLCLVFVLSCHVGLLLRRALARRTHLHRAGSRRRIARHRLHRTDRRPGSSRVPRAEG